MIKKNALYLFVLIALGASAYFFVFKNKWSTLDVNEKDFAVEDTAGISRIMVGDMKGNKLIYTRKGETWFGNDSIQISEAYMSTLLTTIRTLKVKEPVADAAMQNVIKQLSVENKVVEIYDKDNELIKRYFVGPPSLNNKGSYMMIDGSNKPYICHIEGFDGIMDVRYQTNLNEIRSLEIFHFPITKIKSVSVVYPEDQKESFALKISGKDQVQLTMAGAEPGKPNSSILKEENLNRAYEFLNSFRKINCESFINESKIRDSVTAKKPYCMIVLTGIDNHPHELILFHKNIDASSLSQLDAKGNPLKYDLDRYFGLINNGSDFVLIQQQMMWPVLINANMILGKEKPKTLHLPDPSVPPKNK